jgi:hypothetical protein
MGAAAAAATALRPVGAGAAASCVGTFEMALDAERGARAAAGWRLTRVYAAPRRFDLIGLAWPRRAKVEAQVRARRTGGSWTPWVALHPTGDHAPDRGRPASGSEPVFTGAADLFQLRLRGDTRKLRARFVRALPDARKARSRARASRARQVAPGGPSIIPRADWGAASCPPRAAASYGEVHLAFVHHTVTANGYAPEDSAGIVLGICRYHRNSNGWNDVGYNFLVDQYGQIFEGRAGGVDQAVVGAQAQGYNSTSTGIAVLGDMSALGLSDAALDAVASLIAWKLPLHGAPVEGQVTVTSAGGASNRYASGRAVTFERISGHRDGNETACPGEALYAQLEDLRARAAGRSGPVSRLTLSAAAARVRYPTPAALKGSLRFADGSTPAGATVAVEHSEDGITFRSLTAVAADGAGRWSAAVPLPASGEVRARFAGDSTRGPLESAAIAVQVLPRVTVTRTPVRGTVGRKVRVRGTWEPSPAAGEVVVEVERQSGKRWKRVSRKRIAVSDGRFDTTVRAKTAGLHRVVLTAPDAVVRRSFRALAKGRSAGPTGGSRAR